MSSEQYNRKQYAYVRTDWNAHPVRKAFTFHNRFAGNTLCGHMELSLTTKTPLLIKNAGQSMGKGESIESYHLVKDGKKQYLIPAASLKGMIRGVVEAIGNGCYSQYSESYRLLPEPFRLCEYLNNLCIGCRLFGFIAKNQKQYNKQVYRGNVSFSDAVLANKSVDVCCKHQVLTGTENRVGGSPECDGKYLAGRKFFYHFQNRDEDPNVDNMTMCEFIKPEVGFNFAIDFQNITNQDFQVLLYSLVLEKSMWHKLGYAKSRGFGSVRIECRELIFYDNRERYLSGNQAAGIKRIDNLAEFIGNQTKEFKAENPAAMALADLQRIWNNAAEPPANHKESFANNKQAHKKYNDRDNETDTYRPFLNLKKEFKKKND